MIGFALKHLKWILPLLALVGVGLWGAWEAHEAHVSRESLATYRQAEKVATAQAQTAQAQATVLNLAQKAAFVAQAASAMQALSVYQNESKAREKRLQGHLRSIFKRSVKARAWRDTPIPASVLSALKTHHD